MKENNVVKKIKQAMLDANLTQENLGKKMGITQKMVSKWITGKSKPKLETLAKIAKATKKNLNYFLDLSGDSITAAGGHNTISKNNKTYGDNEKEQKKIAELEKEIAYLKGKIEVLERKK